MTVISDIDSFVEQITTHENLVTPEQKQDSLVDHTELQTTYLKKIYQILVFFVVLAIISLIASLFNIYTL